MTLEIFIGIILALICIRYLIKLIMGDYSVVSSEIIRSGSIVDGNETVGAYYDVKITYKNGRIRIKRYES